MTLGVALYPPTAGNTVDAVVANAREAVEAGLTSVWLGQRFDYDAISLAALIGREVPELRVGTSAVPIFARHPLLVASQAQTAQAATHGRFQLGLALGAKALIEPAFGVPYDRPITRLREFLLASRAILSGEKADFHGETITAAPALPTVVPGAEIPVPLLVAAMAPQSLRVTGEFGDGILPFLAGPRTLEQHIVPTLHKAAERAGRPAPRVIAFVIGVVTDDVDGARSAVVEQTSFYESIPSYRRVIELEGHSRAADVAVLGDAAKIESAVQSYFDAGATELVFTQTNLLGEAARRRTWEVLGDIVKASGRDAGNGAGELAPSPGIR